MPRALLTARLAVVALCASSACTSKEIAATPIHVEMRDRFRCDREPGTRGEIDTVVVEIYRVTPGESLGETCCRCASDPVGCVLVETLCRCLDAPIDAVDPEAFAEAFVGLRSGSLGSGGEFCVRIGAIDATDRIDRATEDCACPTHWTADVDPDPVRVCGWTDEPFALGATPTIARSVYCRGILAGDGGRSQHLVGCLEGGETCD